MNTKKIILLIIVLTAIYSILYFLSKNKENIIITRFGTTQWDLYQSYYKYSFKPDIAFRKVGVYEFSWDGKCEYYLVGKHRKLERFEAEDVITSKTWEYKNDSTFMLNGSDYKTLAFEKDSIVLLWNNPSWLDTLILVRSQKKYDKESNRIHFL